MKIKGVWKLVVGAIFFVSGISQGWKGFLSGLIIAAALFAWWYVPNKKAKKAEQVMQYKRDIKKLGTYTTRVAGCPLLYYYVLEYVPYKTVDIEKDIMAGEEKYIEVSAESNKIILSYNKEYIRPKTER